MTGGESVTGGVPAAGRGRLEARVGGRRGGLDFDVEIELAPGEVLAVLGPNGAGKSTVLECLAGLLTPARGRIVLDGRELLSVAESSRRTLPPARRGIGLLGQEPRLFPHLTVRENVAFGPAFGHHSARMSRSRARAQADAWLDRVGLGGLGDRRPRQLSGGQQQRVAIARALAADPAVLLLDEPLASLDAEVAPEIRRVLRDQLAATGTSAVLVSHDVLDAVALADRVAVLDRGRVVESGATAAVLQAPRTPFLAALAGVNLVAGVAVGNRVVAGACAFAGVSSQGSMRGADASPATLPDGARAAAVFRPSSVIVATSRPEGTSLRNIWRDRVAAIEPAPGGALLRFAAPALAAEVTAAALAELGVHEGDEVWLAVKASEVGVHALA